MHFLFELLFVSFWLKGFFQNTRKDVLRDHLFRGCGIFCTVRFVCSCMLFVVMVVI